MRIVFTGGGTGGHIIPNFAVIEELRRQCNNTDILYIGSKQGVEREMVQNYGLKYRGIEVGKLRRYLSWENIKDAFKVPVGVIEAILVLRKFKPQIIFSKGGYVSLPVVIAGKMLRIPTICHESDLTPGLTSKVSAKIGCTLLLSFEESKNFFKSNNVKVVGTPIRNELKEGDKELARQFTGLGMDDRPVLLIVGGSQGARQINDLADKHLDELIKSFDVVHVRGPGNLKIDLVKKGYKQYEYLGKEIKDLYALADVVVTRGGANSLAELGFLKKKAVVIPLSKAFSRGDQEDNAKVYSRKFGWPVLEGQVRDEDFLEAIELMHKSEIKKDKIENASLAIVNFLLQEAR